MRHPRLRALLILGAVLLLAVESDSDQQTTLDDFEENSAWRAAPSKGVKLELSSAEGLHGRALRLDFDFQGRAGWAAATRNLAIDLPENYELAFAIRGEASANDLQVKLVDSSGENVWWAVRRDFVPSRAWAPLRLKKRHFSFAWGPAGGGEIRHVAALEITVAAGSGGRGWIALDDLTLTILPAPAPASRPPILTASSSMRGHGPELAMDGDFSTSWESAAAGPAWLTIDFGEKREFGGLTIRWESDHYARRYRVELSDDGRAWAVVRSVETGKGGRNDLYLPESESRFVRVRLLEAGPGQSYGIEEILVQPLSYSESPNAFFETIARDAPRGTYPRSLSGEQSYWTVVGVDGDTENALFSEDGAVEPKKGSFSVEPFLFIDGRFLSWSDVEIEHSLEQKRLPIPTVTWHRGPITLAITAMAVGPPGASSLEVRYRVANGGSERRHGKLFLAIRPFQVNPPTQFLNGPGGVSPIRRIAWSGSSVQIEGEPRVFPRVAAAGFGAVTFDQGPITDFLSGGATPPSSSVEDAFGYASGALAFDLDLIPGAREEIEVGLPLHPGLAQAAGLERRGARWLFEQQLSDCIGGWRQRLEQVAFQGPPDAQSLFRILSSNLAYILIERDGPAIRPGTRSYARSWIRDGALISSALLRLGQAEAVRAYIDWFSKFQDEDGRVPCCVDRRGGDPVVENDSYGEFLYLIAEYERFTSDRATLERVFPHVERAVAYIDRLRQSRRTENDRRPEKLLFFGLLPESISHEGYSAKPVHSYWDDFWALKGLKDATDLAAALGREDLAGRWATVRDEFASDLYASLSGTIARNGIDYIPGSAELADFDPAATTIALDPAGELDRLPHRELLSTFERYFSESIRRRDGQTAWDAYTPYEMRTVGAFVRVGWRDRAQEMLKFFLAGRRPAEWNAWAEVVGREPRKPRFIGDLPHAWVGADFIRSLLDLFAYERASDGALVLAAGIPADWLADATPIGVERLRTPHGALTYSLRRERAALRFSISGGLAVPRGGIALEPPLERIPRRVTVDGKAVAFSGQELVIHKAPAEICFER